MKSEKAIIIALVMVSSSLLVVGTTYASVNSNSGGKAVSLTNKTRAATQYNLQDLMNQNVISTSISGMPADESILQEPPTPTAGQITINSNTKLSGGDVIDLGLFSVTGKYTTGIELSFHDSELVDATGKVFGNLSQSGKEILLTLTSDYDNSVAYKAIFPSKVLSGQTTLDTEVNDINYKVSWLGQTYNYRMEEVLPIPLTNDDLVQQGRDNFRKYFNLNDGTAASQLALGYYDLTAINNLLTSDGMDAGNTKLPINDFIQVTHINPNANIADVSLYSFYSNNILTGIMPDGSILAQNGVSISSRNNIFVKDDSSTYKGLTSDEIAAKLQPLHYIIVKQADSSYNIAINWGTIGSGTGANSAQKSIDAQVKGQPWTYEPEALGKVNNAYSSTSNALSGDNLNGRGTFTVTYSDTTEPSLMEVSGETTNYDGAKKLGASSDDAIGMIPPSNAADAATQARARFFDTNGNEIAAASYQMGWPADNAVGNPADTYTYTPKNIQGYTLVGLAGTKDINGNLITAGKINSSSPETGTFPSAGLVTSSNQYPVTVNYVYVKNPPTVTTDVITKTIHYVDQDGNKIAPDFSVVTPEITQSIDAVTGDATYSPSETAILAGQVNPEIKGYTIKTSPEGAETDSNVKFGDADIDLTVIYVKNVPDTPTTPDTPIKPGTPTVPNIPTPVNIKEKQSVTLTSSNKEVSSVLPKTGDGEQASSLSLLGSLMALLAILSFGLFSRKKRKISEK